MIASPTFSVVIPTFNRATLVVEAVASVLAQEFTDFELIVVDDGSDDDTAQRLAPHGDRLRYLRQPNAGPAAAKNRGIDAARGAIVGFLDADDRWEPATLGRVAEAFTSRPDAGLVSLMAAEIDAAGRRTGAIQGKRTPGERHTAEGLLLGDAGGCSWFFVRRERLLEVGGFDPSLRSAEECDLALRLAFVTELHALREPLLLRREHGGNLGRDVRLNARSWIRVLEKLACEQPAWVASHRKTWRRAMAKERLRLGRELLAWEAHDAAGLREARRQIRQSLRTYPFWRRGLGYLAWAYIAPATYGRFRRRELRARRP